MKGKKSNKHYHVMLHGGKNSPHSLEYVGQFASEFEAHAKARSLFAEGQVEKQPGRASQPEEIAMYRVVPGSGDSKSASVTECRFDMHRPSLPVGSKARGGRSLKSSR